MRLFVLLIVFVCTSCVSSKKESDVTMNLPEINKLWNYSNPLDSREKFEKLYGDQEKKAPLDYRLQIKTQIARTHSLRAEFSEAHWVLDEIEPQLSEETPVAKVRYLLERGRAFNSNGEKEKATELFEQAYNFGHEIGAHLYSVDAAHMVAISSRHLNDKLEWNQKGLEEAQKSEDKKVRGWIGVFYNNMGWDLFQDKHYERALEKFELGLSHYQDIGAKGQVLIAKWSIAKTYRLLNRTDEALKIQTELLAESGGVDESGYTYEELGELYLIKGEKNKAKEYFGKAYEILSKDIWLQKNEADRLSRLKEMS